MRTVLGEPLSAGGYDLVLAHEHLLIDISCWLDTEHPVHRRLRDLPVGPDSIDLVRSHPFASPDNVVLADPEVAIEELTIDPADHQLGDHDPPGRMLVVDVTPDTAGADPPRLAEISRRSGVDIVRGCGPYIERSWDGRVDPDAVTADIVAAFDDRYPAAVIGEIGTSAPTTAGESRVLRGAAQAQAELQAPLYVHVDPWAPDSRRALDVIEQHGGDLTRTVICHQDIVAVRDPAAVRAVLDRGALVAIDIWGDEDGYGGDPMPTDDERLSAVLGLIEDGWGQRLLHSQDVCTKSQLRRFGGPGYLHLWTRIRPRLERIGLTVDLINDQLAGNALRLLSGV
ncbi:phosphotriesterase-related protein [Microlunatus soli]|uniref:Phosphotriesterase-related protein n=2 Tax=Microlunatus soli TaxID=630515 RepID=A0A1H1RTA5_9ACTN|nr:phosphotriesterase-related protein [Microlunatus soli]